MDFKIYLRSFLSFMFCGIFSLFLNAQTANTYIYASSSGATLDPMSGATTIVVSGVDDIPSTLQNIGFNFVYEGVTYTQFSASPDAFIKLGAPAAVSQFTNAIVSTTNIPKLFPYWDDLATGTNGSVSFVVTGSAPNRILKINWFVTIPRATTGAANSTLQAWLYETTNVIEFKYGTVGGNSISASIGINGAVATNFISITVPGNTSSTVTANNTITAWPGSGTMYRFTPLSGPNIIPAGTTLVTEGCPPANSAIDPGETVTVSFCVRNTGLSNTTNLVGTLQATGGVTSPSGPQNYGVVVVGGANVCRDFSFTTNGTCGGTITATIQLQDGATNLGTITYTFTLGVQNITFTQNFDAVTAPALPAGWVTTMSGAAGVLWVTSTSGTPTPPFDSAPNAAYVPNNTNIGDNRLETPSIPISTSSAQLIFRNNYNLENTFDGGVLEIAIGAGAFQDILTAGGTFVSGGYNGAISVNFQSPILGRQAWTGNSGGFITTRVNLPSSAAGQSIKLRFREGTDVSLAAAGWRIDNVQVVDGYSCCVFATCDQNFDAVTAPAMPQGWSAGTGTGSCGTSTPWVTTSAVSNSVPNSAFTNNPNCVSDEYLVSPSFRVFSATASITFSNSFDLENTFDGMVLEISLNGGAYQDIITAGGSFGGGGYTGTISLSFGSPIAGRMAWTGNSGGFITTVANLPASANGQIAQFRWRRATDNSVGAIGAWIDNIAFSGANCACRLTCPANIVVSNDANQCGAVVNFAAPITGGLCSTVVASPASGSFFPKGITVVTATSAGATCTFTVTVNDTQAPAITCPANITVGNSIGQCGANVTYAPVASDNCPGVTVVNTPASGSFFPVGITTVNSVATDAAGNTSSCSFTVRVNDTENPTFGSSSPVPERLYYKFDGTGTSIPNLALAPPSGTANATIVGSLSQGSTGKCGGALIGTGAATPGNHVNTGWAPNLSTPWTISFWLGPNQIDANPAYLFGSLSAGAFRAFYGGLAGVNNMLLRGGSGDILITGINPTATFITIVYSGTNTVVYKNGAAPQTFAVTFTNSGAGPFLVGGYDNAGFAMNGRMDEFGLYSRALSAAEVLSLFNTCPSSATSCPANITVNNAPNTCGATVTYAAPVGSDNCPGVTTTQIAGLASGSVFPVGVTTNTFRATDASGNTANCTFTVTVVDNQAPVITCPANIRDTTFASSCTLTVTYNVTATDNCPGVTTALVSGLASGSAFPIGATTITWRATDLAGNTSTCSFTVTVVDGRLPVITPLTNFSACVGTNATITVVATNAVSYQWQFYNGTAWVNVAGANSATLTINNVTLAMNTNTYRVIVNGPCTNVTSGNTTLTIRTLPTISLSTSRSPVLIPGQYVNITASPAPPGGTIAWYRNTVLMPTQVSLALSNLSVDNTGTYYAVYTAPNGCTVTSGSVTVSVASSSDLFVYPNPSNGTFQVRIYGQNQPLVLTIYDTKGSRVYQRNMTTGSAAYSRIDVSLPTAAAGHYVLDVRDATGKMVGMKQIFIWR